MRIGIYGAGVRGKKLLNILDRMDVTPDCFIQSEKAADNMHEGIPFLSIDEILCQGEKYCILIAINDKQATKDICNNLLENNYDMSLVFDMNSFIEDNVGYKHRNVGEKECLMCGNQFVQYQGGGLNGDFFLLKKVIGGGYRENAVCPYCGSLDRTRWVYWVLEHCTDILQKECKVIHFAPEKHIREIFEKRELSDYYPADICGRSGVHKIDVTAIPFVDNFADYVIINHVLEHVQDEKKAFSELKRVLKIDGKIIMSFPISMAQNTYECSDIVTPEDRLTHYGQEDHVRLYGIDYKQRIESWGLKVTVYSPEDYLSDKQIKKYGLIKDDVVLVCSK